MTRKEKINQLNDIFAEINEDDNAVCYLTSEDNELIESAIEALSQEPCHNPDEWCHDCSEYNQDKHCCPRYNKVIRNTVEEMKQSCDTISRKETLEALEQEEPLVWCDGADEIAAHSQWLSDVDTIKNMPSVTLGQKTGHWIFDEILDRNYYCSECKSMGVDYWDYCPYCGARMIEPQESEDKE